GSPDMRVPIAHALAWPERLPSGARTLDLFETARLDFEPPDRARFPCLDLAYRALEAGGTASTILNAANEVAVAAFLDGRLAFGAIAPTVQAVLDAVPGQAADALETVLAADRAARQAAQARVAA
ncbi:MAG TPA: 1-deoxy-D-xylulose-5-phosphate reductoisomerase, partial [Gammaproteobacteria bacterium]|nr:1-deoxy-D-xylulose-5-phosphate reductoisomerase [Gammaproteobacteria bacterium]MCH77279.1 1-deoxy-D-xylulose-5-phosphate reductoisomerase [Gammaproteobacteria bacterium]